MQVDGMGSKYEAHDEMNGLMVMQTDTAAASLDKGMDVGAGDVKSDVVGLTKVLLSRAQQRPSGIGSTLVSTPSPVSNGNGPGTAGRMSLSPSSSITNSIQSKKRLDATSERVKMENRERKKRWRELNEDRNKDNDLRCRVNKRANQLFGPEKSAQREAWVASEFEKRQRKRQERESKKHSGNPRISGTPASNLGSDSPTVTPFSRAHENVAGRLSSPKVLSVGSSVNRTQPLIYPSRSLITPTKNPHASNSHHLADPKDSVDSMAKSFTESDDLDSAIKQNSKTNPESSNEHDSSAYATPESGTPEPSNGLISEAHISQKTISQAQLGIEISDAKKQDVELEDINSLEQLDNKPLKLFYQALVVLSQDNSLMNQMIDSLVSNYLHSRLERLKASFQGGPSSSDSTMPLLDLVGSGLTSSPFINFDTKPNELSNNAIASLLRTVDMLSAEDLLKGLSHELDGSTHYS